MPIVVAGETTQNNGLADINWISDPLYTLSADSHYFRTQGRSVNYALLRAAHANRLELQATRDDVVIADSLNVNLLAADFDGEDVAEIHYKPKDDAQLKPRVDNANNNEITGLIVGIGEDTKGFFGPAPVGLPFKQIRVSSTTAAVSIVWTNGAPWTWPTNLPATGKMRILGMRAFSASGYAVRVIQGDRPGVPTQHAKTGQFFWFATPWEVDLANLPSFEIASSTTTAAHIIELAVQYAW